VTYWVFVYLFILTFACAGAMDIAIDRFGVRPDSLFPLMDRLAPEGKRRGPDPWGGKRNGWRRTVSSLGWSIWFVAPNLLVLLELFYAQGRPEGPTVTLLTGLYVVAQAAWCLYLRSRPRAPRPA
jgi:hypothetical protein